MENENIGIMFLMFGANLWYLAGIHRRAPNMTDTNAYGDFICGAYIGVDDKIIVVAPRMGGPFYKKEVKNKPWIDEIILVDESENPKKVLVDVIKQFRIKDGKISLDDRTWIKTGQLYQKKFPTNQITLASRILDPMRMIKDKEEIELMKKSSRIVDDVYEEILNYIEIGITEYDLAHEINYQLAKRGVEYPAFSSGARFTQPGKTQEKYLQLRATQRKLEKGDAITFDFGGCYKGYCSDFGRTAFMGEPPDELKKIYEVAKEAQISAISAMKSGKISAEQLDEVARNIIKKAGYGSFFTHRLGHGIGVTVHEPPFLYKPDNTQLLSGMTVTVEPSIRLPNSYSCRLEDVVMVTKNGGYPLNKFHKEITII
jgi:Xaa-Pro aminopeptidase